MLESFADGWESCHECDGTGFELDACGERSQRPCHLCDGEGIVKTYSANLVVTVVLVALFFGVRSCPWR